jgi:hypothetical protein
MAAQSGIADKIERNCQASFAAAVTGIRYG